MYSISCHTEYHQNWISSTPIATIFSSSDYPYIQNICFSKIFIRSYFYGLSPFKNREVNPLKLSTLIIWSSFWFSAWIIGCRINILCHLVFVLTHGFFGCLNSVSWFNTWKIMDPRSCDSWQPSHQGLCLAYIN